MRNILFIVNKKAGTDEKKRFPEQVKKILDGKQFSYDIVYTQYRGHAIELTRDAVRNKTDIIAAVGGDGSVNEVAQALPGKESLLAIIPKGSGNGLARALGIPLQTESAIALLSRNHEMAIDVGFANGHLFLSNAGVGFDTLIARLFADNKGRGLLNYSKLVINAIRHYQSATYKLETESEALEEKAFFITAANGNQFGYNFKIAPDAKLNDGLLDICIMKPLHWSHLPAVSLRALSGKLSGSKFVKHIRCRQLVISSEETLEWMQVDGDALQVTNNRVEIVLQEKAIRILAP